MLIGNDTAYKTVDTAFDHDIGYFDSVSKFVRNFYAISKSSW